MDKVEVTIQFTPEDLQYAYKLHFHKMNPLRSKLVLILGGILILLGIILVVLQSMAGIISWASWFFIIYGLLLVTYYYWRFNRMGKAAYKKLVDFHNPFAFTFTSDGVLSVGKTVKSDNTWEHYQIALIRSDIILLYPNKLRFVLLPKSYFSDGEFEQITAWVREKVKCK